MGETGHARTTANGASDLDALVLLSNATEIVLGLGSAQALDGFPRRGKNDPIFKLRQAHNALPTPSRQ